MIDYSESLINIKQLRKKAHEAILDRRWDAACGFVDEIIINAAHMKIFCLDQIKD
tara:strand:+ start:155 stop:319 length:165 start_codon:yes stop_codon:yes gene_type:complete